MNFWTILIILLIVGAVGGGHWGGPTAGTGFYPATYGYGIGTLLVIVLVVLLFRGGL